MKTFQDFLKEVKKSAASRLLRIMKDKELIKNPPRMKRTEDSKEKNKCPSCHSTDIKTYSSGDKECHTCHKTWDVESVAEEVVAESSEQKFKVTVDHHGSNRDVPLYTKTYPVRASNEKEAIDTIRKFFGGRNHRVEQAVAEEVVAEGGPFSYGTKKPRRGSIASNAAQKRKEQDKRYQPIEPQDQMVGVAKVLKKEEVVAEGSEGKTPGVALSKAYKKDFDDKKPGHNKPETALTGTYSKTGKPGGELKKQGVAESEKSPMFKDAQRADHIRSLKNLIAIAKEKGRQLRVQELELELKKLQGIAETSDYFRRREREEAIISGRKPARKRAPAQTSDYARRRQQEKNKEQGVSEEVEKQLVKEYKIYKAKHVAWVVSHGDGHVSRFKPHEDDAAKAQFEKVKGNRGAWIAAIDQHDQSIRMNSLKAMRKKQVVAEETSDKSYTICKRCGGRGKVWKSTRDPKTVLPGNNQDKDTKRYTCGACKGVGIIKEEFVAEEKHRVQVTISDPNHVAVSKRKEQVQKHIRVSAEDKDSAVEKAKAYYNKAGYKVHSAEHVGMIKEEGSACEKPVKEQAELIDELSRDLTQYRKKAALITSAADQAKKYDIGHSKFKGILKSTFKKIQKC
jgi:ribosomal protein L37AE/L43A